MRSPTLSFWVAYSEQGTVFFDHLAVAAHNRGGSSAFTVATV
jgi:hypothetical protein